jgi:hypothetical protein
MSWASLEGAEHHLVELVRQGEEFVVVDLHQERDSVGPLAREHAQDAEGRADGVAAPFGGQPDDVLRIEVDRVLGEAGAGRVFDALIDRQDRHVPAAAQPAMSVEALEVRQHAVAAVRRNEDPIDEIRPREDGAGPWRPWVGG